MSGRISFIGAGPGAADLITLRGARRIAEADIVVWSPTVVDADCVREHATAEAELIDCSRVGHEQILDVYRRAAVKKLSVVRLHSGDATLWGAVQSSTTPRRRSAWKSRSSPASRPCPPPRPRQAVSLARSRPPHRSC